MLQVVIANRLRDGIVVFLAANGGWVEYLDDARLADGEQEAKEMLEAARAAEAHQVVVGAELVPVDRSGGRITPTRYRDRIRSQGPSVRCDLGKQARG